MDAVADAAEANALSLGKTNATATKNIEINLIPIPSRGHTPNTLVSPYFMNSQLHSPL